MSVTGAKVIWHGNRFNRELRAAAVDAVEAVTDHLVTKCKEAVDTSFPPASIPGMPPHKRTGTGQEAIMRVTLPEKVESYLVVSEDGRHMIYLENGTRLMEPRPWLRPTFLANRDIMRKIAQDKLREVFK